MRISTPLMYQQTMGHIVDSQADWLRDGEKLSTGKKIITPSDDPIAAAQIIVVSQAQAQNHQYSLARTFATQRESLEDNILSQVVSVVQSALTKVVQAGNAILSNDDRAALATDLQGMRDQLLNLANSTDGNGRYIFAGYKTEAPPFVEVPGATAGTTRIEYHGSDMAIEQKVDANRTMTVGHTGQQIFMTLPSIIKPEPEIDDPDKPGAKITPTSEANIFNSLDAVIATLNTPAETEDDFTALNAAIDKSNRGLHNSMSQILTVHAQVGVQLSELKNLDQIGNQRDIDTRVQRSSLEDVDWNEAISSYKLKMYALSAAYQTFTDMKGLSLFQLNR